MVGGGGALFLFVLFLSFFFFNNRTPQISMKSPRYPFSVIASLAQRGFAFRILPCDLPLVPCIFATLQFLTSLWLEIS